VNNENIGIEKITYYLPKNKVSSDDLVEKYGYDKSFIEEKVGVKQLFKAQDESSTDLAESALNPLLLSEEGLRDKVQLLVVCTQTPEFQLPQTSSILQSRCGLNSSIASFDLSLGCSGYVYGLSVVESLMVSHGYSHAVLVTVDKYSSIIDKNDKNTQCLFSDAASATLLCHDGKLELGHYKFGTDGTMYDSLIVRDNGEADEGVLSKVLHMNGRNIFNFTVSRIPDEIAEVCQLNNVSQQEVDSYILHQASSFVLTSIAKKCLYDQQEKFVNYMGMFGNTTSSSIPIALCQLASEGGAVGKNILISGFGVGLSWASTILFNKKGFTNE
jgi:3-oxoacyl-[acyl-carrier-protein] synthase III